MELLSVLNRPPSAAAKRTAKPQVLTNWHVDDALAGEEGGKHADFDEQNGVFVVPRDGLYSIVVEVIPTDGSANVSDALSRRKEVSYAVRIDEPPNDDEDDEGDYDDITTDFRDVGPVSFGELIHMKTGTRVSIQGLLAARRESIRLKIELVQRKRKRARSPELSKKELKKLKKQQKKRRRESSSTAASESDTAGSSEWSFSSDESGRDTDPEPSGKQLAAKLKIKY